MVPKEPMCLKYLRQKDCSHFDKISKRHQQFQPKRSRIRYLAVPKYVRSVPKLNRFPKYSRKTTIIREEPCLTRTEQLSYPYLRKLLAVQREYGRILGDQRLFILNRTTRKSVLSLYSRLANIQAPKEREHVPGWTKKEWAIHKKYLRKLAMPKKIFSPLKQPHAWKDLSQMKRYKKLAKPKNRREAQMPKWVLTSNLKNYTPTARIIFLSKAKERDEKLHYRPLPIAIRQAAKKYEATDRIKELATPPEVRLGESDLKENPFGISPNALKAKCSDRVNELAQPKEYEETHTRPNPFMISPAALKAKVTPRTLALAKPKGS